MKNQLQAAAGMVLAMTILAMGASHAGVFDDINKALDTVKKGATLIPGAPGESSGSAAVFGNATAGGGYANRHAMLPMDLTPYPRAKLAQRIDNPLERLVIPLTTPVRTPEGYVSALATPMQGKVTMLTFLHYENDSPLLIREFYESWVASQGFDRLLICEAPCKALPSSYDWRQMLDPTNRLDASNLPTEPTYIVGYKQGAMVVVGVGKRYAAYSSLIKIVEGQILDERPWLAATAKRAPLPAVALVRPVSGHVPYPAPPPPAPARALMPIAQQADKADATVPAARQGQAPMTGSRPSAPSVTTEEITPDQLAARLASASGVTVVHFSSTDAGCPFCVRSNARFDTLAKSKAGQATFLRVMWHPYQQAFDDPVAVQYNLVGLPAFIAFNGATVARRADGDMSAVQLSNKLMAH